MTPRTDPTEPRTEAACPICHHDVDHDSPCPVGCPQCSSVPSTKAGRKAVDAGWSVRTVLAIEAEAAQGAAPPRRAEPPAGTVFTERCSGIVCIHADCKRHSQYGEMYCGEHGGPPEYASDSEGAAPRAEGLDVALADWAEDFDDGWGDLFASDSFDEGGYTLLDHGPDHTRKEFRLLRIWRSRPSDERVPHE